VLWGCFAAEGTGALHRTDGIMRKEEDVDVLKQHLKTSASLGDKWFFQTDPKHTSKLVPQGLKDNKVKALEWPSQSPELNPVEKMWAALKRRVGARRPTGLTQFHRFCPEEWARIPAKWEKLVEGNPKCFEFYGNTATYSLKTLNSVKQWLCQFDDN